MPALTPDRLQTHARELASAFDVRLIESDQLRPEEAIALTHLRVVLISPVREETTYAVALHEIGHLASALGDVHAAALAGTPTAARLANLKRIEEDAAWSWARHYALEWTPVMEQVATWAEGTYAAPKPEAPAKPSAPIDWRSYGM